MIGRFLCLIGLHKHKVRIERRPCMHGMKSGWEAVPVARCQRCNATMRYDP